jgi:hypothetical protein
MILKLMFVWLKIIRTIQPQFIITWKAEIRRIVVAPGQPKQKCSPDPISMGKNLGVVALV